jgi:Aldehyde ferredoxin oxidoreductase, N-terminal domain
VYAGNLGEGNWGDGLIMQDLCKQCPHPVPCANACPRDAIVAKPPLNARVVIGEISEMMGPEVVVAAIGQSGENLVPMSVVMNSYSHSAGGVGGVMGSKHLKAIAVRRTGSVQIGSDKGEWEKLVRYHLSLLGANNQHVVPSSPQPWAEYFNPASRWKASKGRAWGASSPPIDTGTCDHQYSVQSRSPMPFARQLHSQWSSP